MPFLPPANTGSGTIRTMIPEGAQPCGASVGNSGLGQVLDLVAAIHQTPLFAEHLPEAGLGRDDFLQSPGGHLRFDSVRDHNGRMILAKPGCQNGADTSAVRRRTPAPSGTRATDAAGAAV